MNNELQVIPTNLGTGVTVLEDANGINEPIYAATEILNNMAVTTGDMEDAIKIYARFQSLLNGFTETLEMKNDEFGGPKYAPMIIERVTERLYECGIGEETIESITSDMKESELFERIAEAEESMINEYVDAYAMQIANVIKEQSGFTNASQRALEESFRGRR